jgi:hypothetical protein
VFFNKFISRSSSSIPFFIHWPILYAVGIFQRGTTNGGDVSEGDCGELTGDEWRGTNQEFYQLYADWCKKYEMRPRTAVGFGREMTPYMLRGWIGKWGSHGAYGKFIDLKAIRG